MMQHTNDNYDTFERGATKSYSSSSACTEEFSLVNAAGFEPKRKSCRLWTEKLRVLNRKEKAAHAMTLPRNCKKMCCRRGTEKRMLQMIIYVFSMSILNIYRLFCADLLSNLIFWFWAEQMLIRCIYAAMLHAAARTLGKLVVHDRPRFFPIFFSLFPSRRARSGLCM